MQNIVMRAINVSCHSIKEPASRTSHNYFFALHFHDRIHFCTISLRDRILYVLCIHVFMHTKENQRHQRI